MAAVLPALDTVTSVKKPAQELFTLTIVFEINFSTAAQRKKQLPACPSIDTVTSTISPR